MNVLDSSLTLNMTYFPSKIEKWSRFELVCVFKNIFSRSVDGIAFAKKVSSNCYPLYQKISEIEKTKDSLCKNYLISQLLFKLNNLYKKNNLNKRGFSPELTKSSSESIMEIPPIPTDGELQEFWKENPIILRSNFGDLGGYLTSHSFIIKTSELPGREIIANKIFHHLGIVTPKIKEIHRSTCEGRNIEKLLVRNEQITPKRLNFRKNNSYFITSRVYGVNLEELSKEVADHSFLDNKENYYHFLEQLAMIASVDLYIGYQGRFSLLGFSNLGKIMLLCDKSSCIRTVVAVDQNVALSKCDIFSGRSHLQKMKNHLLRILETGEEAMQTLYDDLPSYFQSYESRSKALNILWKSFLKGIRLIPEKLSESDILGMGKYCNERTHFDQVDVRDLIDFREFFWEIYQEWCAEQSNLTSTVSLVELFDFIKKQDETKELISKIQRLHQSISFCYDSALKVPAQWNHSKKIISLRTIRNALPNFLFELLNAASEPLAKLLDGLPSNEREDFVNQVELIEYTNLLAAKKIFQKWKEKGVADCDFFDAVPDSFEQHLKLQVKSGHSEHIRKLQQLFRETFRVNRVLNG